MGTINELPRIWPVLNEPESNNYINQSFKNQVVKSAMFIITDISASAAQWLQDNFHDDTDTTWSIIICVKPNGNVKKNTLESLWQMTSNYQEKFKIRLLAPELILSRNLNINICLWTEQESNDYRLYFGTTPSLGQGFSDEGFVNFAVKPDPILLDKSVSLFERYWSVAKPLTYQLCMIPNIIINQPSEDLINSWNSYCDSFFNLNNDEVPEPDKSLDQKTDNGSEDDQKEPTLSERHKIKKISVLESKLLELSDKGHCVKLSYPTPPLEISIPPKILGLSENDQVGSIKRTVSYKIELFDDETQRILDTSRNGIRDILNLLSYRFADGQWWITKEADKLLKLKMDECKKEASDLLQKEGEGGVVQFLAKRKPDLYQSCQKYYKDKYPNAEFTDKQMNVVLRFLAGKISEIFEKGISPVLNPYSVQLSFSSDSVHDDAWENVRIFLEDVASRPRKLISKNELEIFSLKHSLEVNEYVSAMDILNDNIWKIYFMDDYRATKIAKEELKLLNHISSSDKSNRNKCEMFLLIIEGESEKVSLL